LVWFDVQLLVWFGSGLLFDLDLKILSGNHVPVGWFGLVWFGSYHICNLDPGLPSSHHVSAVDLVWL
jgi:hypothetical protein